MCADRSTGPWFPGKYLAGACGTPDIRGESAAWQRSDLPTPFQIHARLLQSRPGLQGCSQAFCYQDIGLVVVRKLRMSVVNLCQLPNAIEPRLCRRRAMLGVVDPNWDRWTGESERGRVFHLYSQVKQIRLTGESVKRVVPGGYLAKLPAAKMALPASLESKRLVLQMKRWCGLASERCSGAESGAGCYRINNGSLSERLTRR